MVHKTFSNHLQQAKIGRRKLRQGSLLILSALTLDALLGLYFVMAAKPEIHEFGISPSLFSVFLLASIPVVGFGVHLMVKGLRMETRGYTDDLKESEKQLREIISKTTNSSI